MQKLLSFRQGRQIYKDFLNEMQQVTVVSQIAIHPDDRAVFFM